MRVELPRVKKARIEIIPLIDVIFFCLATFVLYTLQMNRNQQLPLKLPQAQTATQQQSQESEPILLTVTEAGSIYWNRDQLTMEQLQVKVGDYLKDEPNPKILINGEERTPVGLTIELLDNLLRLGLERDRVTFVSAIRPLPRT